MAEVSHSVTRQFAAEILNVSVRTLDRYSKVDKISSMRRGRQLFFNEQELLDFKAKQLAQQQLQEVQEKRHSRQQTKNVKRAKSRAKKVTSRQAEFADVEAAQVMEQDDLEEAYDDIDAGFAEIRDSMLRRSPEEGIYRSLYKKAEVELKGVREKLEMANYQVGRLESQLTSSVPQLEFKRQKQELLELAQENREKTSDITVLEQQFRIERWVKRLYAGFLFFMMGLIPLLVILRLFA
jgi:chromosome segregation ATPase